MYVVLWVCILLGLSVAVIESHDDVLPLCTYSLSPLHVKQHNQTSGFVDANNTHHCSRTTDVCFILWQEDPKNKSITIFTQGCWDGGDPNCLRNECIAIKKHIKRPNFCCCTGNFCNNNITEGYLIDATDTVPENPARENVSGMSYTMQVVIAVVGTVSILVIGVFGYFFSRVCLANTKRSNESLNLIEAPPPIPPTFDLDTLKIQKESIGQGGFGSVYCGNLNDRIVAVKIFPYVHRQYFFNERDIYMLPHLKHPSIPEYIGYQDRIGDDERPEYLLVLSYCPLGCLQNYLKERTIDWSQLCKMSLSIARGLAHLHTEVTKDDKFKHCIAHRDLSSRNVLMKADGTCMLCDFGFALQVSGSKYFVNGVEGQAEADSLTEVGTLRYKAPELLEGSVNLRDLESSLKQIDIYALGLILWEIATRCSDLYQGLEVPSYKLPFEAEVGAHATSDQIKNFVVMLKTRPLFPDIWKATNPAINLLKDTIEDSWDQDAEARLTALCVKERVKELPDLWKRYKAELGGHGGILPSPTLNSNLHKLYNSNKLSSNVDCCDNDQLICPRERANSLSECTTETLLSPSTEVVNCKNLINSNSPPVKITVPLQPFQGRNPCLARNLMQQQPDDLPVIGNSLVDCPSKYSSNKKFYSLSDGDTVLSVPSVGVENSLFTNTKQNCNPIPYVQNQVNTIPKKPNLNGNVSKDFWNKIAGLLVSLNNKTSSNNCNLPEEQQLLKGSAISSPISPSDIDGRQGQTNPVDTFWHSSDVKISNDFVANSDKIKLNGSIPAAELFQSNDMDHLNEEKITNIPNNPFCNGSLIDEKESKDSDLLSNVATSETASNPDKSKRPTTLPVQVLTNGFDADDSYEASDVDVDIAAEVANESAPQYDKSKVVRRGSGNRRKGVKRVQTPYEITGRFSLIDDRIMSSQDLPTASETNGTHSQFDNVKSSASVPNMNSICSQASKWQLEKKEETEIKEIPKVKPLNGLFVPVSHNVLIV